MISMNSSFLKGLLLGTFGGTLTVHEILVNGSLLLTCFGGALAVLGGYWAYRTKRLEHRIKQIELARLEGERFP